MAFVRSVVSANLAMVSTGLVLGWASPSVPKLQAEDSPILITDSQASWIISLPTFGSCVSALLSIALLRRSGRKSVMLYSAIPDVLGWLLCTFATNVMQLYVARFLLGFATGLRFTSLPLYFSEISPTKNRGAAGSSIYFSIKIGILIAYTIPVFMSIKIASLFAMSFPVIFVLFFAWCPESPHFLLLRGKYGKARAALVKLRRTEEVEDEMKMMTDMVENDLSTNTTVFDLISVPSNRKAFYILLFLVMAEFLTGNQTVIAYAQTIFDAARKNTDGQYLTVMLGLVQLSTVVFTMILVDRGGRKPLLLFSMSGMGVCSFIIAVYFYLQDSGRDVSPISWLTTIAVIIFTISYAIGLSSIPPIMVGELFPASVKPKAAGFFVIFGNFCTFVILKSFYEITAFGGLHTLFFIYTACDVLGMLHVAFFVPETKRRTLKDVQNMIVNKRDKDCEGKNSYAMQ